MKSLTSGLQSLTSWMKSFTLLRVLAIGCSATSQRDVPAMIREALYWGDCGRGKITAECDFGFEMWRIIANFVAKSQYTVIFDCL